MVISSNYIELYLNRKVRRKMTKRQWREIGESDWLDCHSDSWWEYCNKSAEHDTRTI